MYAYVIFLLHEIISWLYQDRIIIKPIMHYRFSLMNTRTDFFFKFVSDFHFSDLISNVGWANISETKLEIVATLTQERAQSLQQLLLSSARNWAEAPVWPARTIARKRLQWHACGSEYAAHSLTTTIATTHAHTPHNPSNKNYCSRCPCLEFHKSNKMCCTARLHTKSMDRQVNNANDSNSNFPFNRMSRKY